MKEIRKIDEEGISLKIIDLLAGESLSNLIGKETGFLLITGNITCYLNETISRITRNNVFTEKSGFIHVNNQDIAKIIAIQDSQIAIIEMENDKVFNSKVYKSDMIIEDNLAGKNLEGKDSRTIRDIVTIGTEPNADIIVGEVISGAGCWSSYPPHSHNQPELYYYKFDHPNGFGLSVVGDDVSIVKDGDYSIIPGDLLHPQSSAPGYRMFYIWIIRNLEGNPWNTRTYAEEHIHLMEEK